MREKKKRRRSTSSLSKPRRSKKKIKPLLLFLSLSLSPQDTVIAIRKKPSTDGSPPRLRLINLEREQYKVSFLFSGDLFSSSSSSPRTLFFLTLHLSLFLPPPPPLVLPFPGPRLRRQPGHGRRHGPPLVGQLLRLRLQGRLRVPELERGTQSPGAVLSRRACPRHGASRLRAVVVRGAGVRLGAGGAGGARGGGGGDAGGRRDVRGELREVRCVFFFSFCLFFFFGRVFRSRSH